MGSERKPRVRNRQAAREAVCVRVMVCERRGFFCGAGENASVTNRAVEDEKLLVKRAPSILTREDDLTGLGTCTWQAK